MQHYACIFEILAQLGDIQLFHLIKKEKADIPIKEYLLLLLDKVLHNIFIL